MDPLNAFRFHETADAIPILSQEDVWLMLDSFGGWTDLAVLAAECRTGGQVDEIGIFRRREPGMATVVFATQWRPEVILVLNLEDMVRVDVMSAGVYGGVWVRLDENGFCVDFPDGARIAAKRALYRIVPSTGATQQGIP